MKRRPAETISAGGGIAALVVSIADHNLTAAIVSAVGFVPAVVTLLVANGGLRGCLRLIWRGSP